MIICGQLVIICICFPYTFPFAKLYFCVLLKPCKKLEWFIVLICACVCCGLIPLTVKHHAASHSLLPWWDEEIQKKVEPTGLDKNSLIIDINSNRTNPAIVVRREKQVTHITVAPHPLTDARPVPSSNQPVCHPLFPFRYQAKCPVVWNIPLASWSHLFCPCFSHLLAHLLTGRGWETEKSLT